MHAGRGHVEPAPGPVITSGCSRYRSVVNTTWLSVPRRAPSALPSRHRREADRGRARVSPRHVAPHHAAFLRRPATRSTHSLSKRSSVSRNSGAACRAPALARATRPTSVNAAREAEQPPEDECLPRHVHAREVLARIGLRVAAAHRLAHRRREGPSGAHLAQQESQRAGQASIDAVDAVTRLEQLPGGVDDRQPGAHGRLEQQAPSTRARRGEERVAHPARRSVSGRLLASTTSMPVSSTWRRMPAVSLAVTSTTTGRGSACFAMNASASVDVGCHAAARPAQWRAPSPSPARARQPPRGEARRVEHEAGAVDHRRDLELDPGDAARGG